MSILAIIIGLGGLLWGADRFVAGAAAVAQHFAVPPLVIGMVIVGFGTSAPELLVSGLAAYEGKPALALGNAYGSNIANIALILGLTAAISPIAVKSKVLRTELPILAVVSLGAAWQVRDGTVSRSDGVLLLVAFAAFMGWTSWKGITRESDAFGAEIEQELQAHSMPVGKAGFWLAGGLVLLIGSSQALVWGAVQMATLLGVSDLVIGLTVVAVGTSLPELASSLVATRRGEHDIALGNVIGSNLFNTLAVVGVAATIHGFECEREVVYRDVPVMLGLTASLFVFGFGFRGPGRINRFEGALLVITYLAYTTFLAWSVGSKRF